MPRVLLTGSRRGLLKISLTKLIQGRTGVSLSVAKAQTDSLLEGQIVILELQTSDKARAFVAAARELGAIAEVPSGPAPANKSRTA